MVSMICEKVRVKKNFHNFRFSRQETLQSNVSWLHGTTIRLSSVEKKLIFLVLVDSVKSGY